MSSGNQFYNIHDFVLNFVTVRSKIFSLPKTKINNYAFNLNFYFEFQFIKLIQGYICSFNLV